MCSLLCCVCLCSSCTVCVLRCVRVGSEGKEREGGGWRVGLGGVWACPRCVWRFARTVVCVYLLVMLIFTTNPDGLHSQREMLVFCSCPSPFVTACLFSEVFVIPTTKTAKVPSDKTSRLKLALVGSLVWLLLALFGAAHFAHKHMRIRHRWRGTKKQHCSKMAKDSGERGVGGRNDSIGSPLRIFS